MGRSLPVYDGFVRTRLTLLIACLVWGGCDASRTLVIDLRTDWVPGQEVVGIRTAVDGEVVDERDVSFGEPLAAGIRLAEREGIAPGAHDVTVLLRDPDGGTLAARRVRVTVDGSTAVTVVISRDCAGVTCDDPSASECLGGRCVSVECTPENPGACPDDGCGSGVGAGGRRSASRASFFARSSR